MKFTFFFVIIFICLFNTVEAALYVKPSFMYKTTKDKEYFSYISGQSDEVSAVSNYFDFSFGWLSDQGVMVGMNFISETINEDKTTRNTLTNAKTQVNTSIKKNGRGLSLGWSSTKNHGPFIIYTHLAEVLMEYDQTYKSGAVKLEYDPYEHTGTGFQVEAGYFAKISNIGITAQITYRDVKFTEYDYGSLSGSDRDINQTEIIPFLGLIFIL